MPIAAPFLLARNRITAALRAWFEARAFVEVETPALQVSPEQRRRICTPSPPRRLASMNAEHRSIYAHSPEFAAKKLLAAGETAHLRIRPRLAQPRAQGGCITPEFTLLLEWYRVGEAYETLMARLRGPACRSAAEAAGSTAVLGKISRRQHRSARRGRTGDAGRGFRPYFAGIDTPGDRSGRRREATVTPCSWRGQGAGCPHGRRRHLVKTTSSVGCWWRRLSRILACDRATILGDYPVSEAALARPKAADPPRGRAVRALCLWRPNSPTASASSPRTGRAACRRFEAEMAEKARVYGAERYPHRRRFPGLHSTAMPETERQGARMGLDRLVMLATGAPHIEQVLWGAEWPRLRPRAPSLARARSEALRPQTVLRLERTR